MCLLTSFQEEIQKLAGQIEHMKIVGMLTDNRHIRAKKDGYFTKENLVKQLDLFQPHFKTTNSQQVSYLWNSMAYTNPHI